MTDRNGRRLPALSKWPNPDKLAHQIEQWSKAEQEQQDRAMLREFTENYGLGLGS